MRQCACGISPPPRQSACSVAVATPQRSLASPSVRMVFSSPRAATTANYCYGTCQPARYAAAYARMQLRSGASHSHRRAHSSPPARATALSQYGTRLLPQRPSHRRRRIQHKLSAALTPTGLRKLQRQTEAPAPTRRRPNTSSCASTQSTRRWHRCATHAPICCLRRAPFVRPISRSSRALHERDERARCHLQAPRRTACQPPNLCVMRV